MPKLWWEKLSDDELLDVRLCDLELRAERGWLADPLARLDRELERGGFVFRPSVWLSTDWFSPHGVPGFAIPFYLAHPRLTRIERRLMFEAEGSPRGWCLKLLRHEAAHALDTGYRLRRRKSFREVFGKATTPYFQTYVPLQGSRDFVHNLDDWYAQSHPTEDFAETFAVWLRSRGRWRALYAGWPALAKLEYVDALMREIAPQKPRVRSREKPDSLPRVRLTLREYYGRKCAHYGDEDRSSYDRDLKRLFTAGRAPGRRSAAAFLRERRLELRRQVAGWTGQRPFVVDEVVRGMILRCRELDLHLHHSERETSEGAAVLVTLHTARIERMRHREYFR